VAAAAVAAATLTVLLTAAPAHAAPVACSTSGTWRQGEVNVYWFDVEQGDSQLIVGPTGKTLLIDLGENSWNSQGTSTRATAVAQQIRSICGTGANPVALDYVMISHHHLDHIGYAHVSEDGSSTIGNGIYQLLTPTSVGGLGFTVGQLFDRDGGTWTDANGNGRCEVGTATAPAPEVAWHNVGTTSQTGRRFICWLYGPAGQADRANIQGKVTTLTNAGGWPSIDLGGGASGAIVNANGKDTMQADGVTPVSGDHSLDAVPPSENDYSIAVKVTYGAYKYGTAGDSDGEYATSGNGYTYNNIEAGLPAKFGSANFDTVRANHHGSGHSSSSAYVNAMDPETSVISCGNNSYGHPSNSALNAFRAVSSDIFLTNNPCVTTDDGGAPIDYSGTLNTNGTVHLYTTNAGANYAVDYDSGTRSYTSGAGGGSQGDPTQIRVNEFMPAPSSGNEWIELYNPTGVAVDVSGYFVDDVAGGGVAPKQIPSGTVIAAGGRWVFEFASGFLNNTGSDAARYTSPGGAELDAYTYSLGSTQYEKVYHRNGDGGAWCGTVSTNVSKGTTNPATCP
jgi:beta-lactamase superfamily II metal-dependent hydrolase